ncbi:MAG TPA: nitroreductase family protein [Propionibacteriaceae bacterium]|nr:nitroreductase family protein [Propionibacteriaceae bacterium]
MTIALDRTAATDAPILDVLAERFSTRVFDPRVTIDEAALASALEAARWAPSANNTQPWRFIVTRRGTEAFDAIYRSLRDFNKSWAGDASALVVAAATTTSEDGRPMPYAQYDTGQAVAHFTVQAHAAGLATHQMGGFDRDAVRAAFDLPDDIAPLTVIAVGALGSLEETSEEVRAREAAPRTRRAISESVLVND